MRVIRYNRRLPAVELDAAPVYDFLASVEVASTETPDEFEVAGEWRALARANGGVALATLLRGTGEVAVLHREMATLLLLAPDGPKSVPAFLDFLMTMPAERLATLMLQMTDCGEGESPAAAQVAAAVGGDRAGVSELLRGLSGERRRRAALWLADPAGVQSDLIAALRAWYGDAFAAHEDRLAAIVERDRAAKEKIHSQSGAEGLLRAVGGTLQFAFGPGIRRVVLAPAVTTRPAIFFSPEDTEAGLQVVVFPVADESLEEPEELAPPRQLVRLYKALCDETRLKILRLVAHEELYATEIAERLGLSKATVSHHMVLLRAAGLVEVWGERKVERYYALHREALDLPAAELRRYLGQ